MTPELRSALRSILIVLGTSLVAKGYVDEVTWQTIVGAVIDLGAAAWGIWAKRPHTGEALQIAQKVVDSDVPQPLNAEGQEVK